MQGLTRQEVEEGVHEYAKWGYSPSFGFSSTGYEDYDTEIRGITAKEYARANDEGKAEIVERAYQIYRSVGIFPIKYYTNAGVFNEIEKCVHYDAQFDGDTVSTGAGVGTGLCNWLFPNLYHTPSARDEGKEGGRTMWERFHSEEYLRRAIRFTLSYESGCPTPSAVLAGLRLTGSAPTNFRPMNAQAIVERFTPENGTYLDMSAGYGGRLLGTATSQKGINYIGIDPCRETMYHLWELHDYLKDANVGGTIELNCCGSEEYDPIPESVDFAFTSPPYFNLEVYSTDESQCYNKYPEIQGWLEGYVRGTVRMVKRALKKGRVYGVNIADFDIGNQRVSFVDAWKEISEQEGLPYVGTLYLGVKARAGSALKDANDTKKENILLFKK